MLLRNLDSDSKRRISLLWRTNKDTRIEIHWIQDYICRKKALNLYYEYSKDDHIPIIESSG